MVLQTSNPQCESGVGELWLQACLDSRVGPLIKNKQHQPSVLCLALLMGNGLCSASLPPSLVLCSEGRDADPVPSLLMSFLILIRDKVNSRYSHKGDSGQTLQQELPGSVDAKQQTPVVALKYILASSIG